MMFQNIIIILFQACKILKIYFFVLSYWYPAENGRKNTDLIYHLTLEKSEFCLSDLVF